MRATDTLDLRADLKTKVDDFRYAKTMEHHLILDFTRAKPNENPRPAETLAEAFVVAAQHAARDGENFFVSADMCDLVSFSARMLDSTDFMDVTLAPSKSGFCYFEAPIEIKDNRGQTLKINAFLWQQVAVRGGGEAVLLHMWNDEYRTPDDAAEKGRTALKRAEMIGRWGYIGSQTYVNNDPLGDEFQPMMSEEAARLYEEEGSTPHQTTNVMRIAHALWLMLGQTITSSTKESGDKRQEREMKWMDLPNDVTVIQLRRSESKPREGESAVEWKHRWITRGHWRWQPYKEKGEWIRKRIWINPYVKGPGDKPLILTRKVNALVR